MTTDELEVAAYLAGDTDRADLLARACESIGPIDAEFIEPGEVVESVWINVGAGAIYACIKGPSFSLDVRLTGGRDAADDLRKLADDERKKAHQLIKRAYRMELAAERLK